MEEQIPDKLTKTADGAEFLILKSWTNEEETDFVCYSWVIGEHRSLKLIQRG